MTYKSNWRDRLAYHIATIALTKIATREYHDFVWVLTHEGHKVVDEKLGLSEAHTYEGSQ